jgi:N-acetylglucosaminyldiphosphoundecaprenol N-acetyl-beta-D-mannosaminyltransferase
MEGTLSIINESIKEKRTLRHVVVNAAKLVNMQKDKELYNSVVTCDVINADGQSVVWASRFLGQPLPARVAGIDLMDRLVKMAYQEGYKIYLLGAKEAIVKKVAEVYSEKYSPSIIAGYNNGYFSVADEPNIAAKISASKADILFVAISSPKKEIFLNKYEAVMNVPFVMGVGGSFDVVSGITKRAPVWMQNMGLEWFYRFLQEPGRMWKRYLVTNSLFIYYVLREKFKVKRNNQQYSPVNSKA